MRIVNRSDCRIEQSLHQLGIFKGHAKKLTILDERYRSSTGTLDQNANCVSFGGLTAITGYCWSVNFTLAIAIVPELSIVECPAAAGVTKCSALNVFPGDGPGHSNLDESSLQNFYLEEVIGLRHHRGISYRCLEASGVLDFDQASVFNHQLRGRLVWVPSKQV